MLWWLYWSVCVDVSVICCDVFVVVGVYVCGGGGCVGLCLCAYTCMFDCECVCWCRCGGDQLIYV